MAATSTLLTVFGVHVAAMASPGPNFLLVSQAGLRHSRRHALVTASGVAAGALVLSSAAALGLGVVLDEVRPLYLALKIGGGLYLVWLGIQMWRNARTPIGLGTGISVTGTGQCFRLGLLTNLTNPKAAIFYGSVLTALLPSHGPVWVPITAVAIITVNALWWHVTLAVVFSTAPVQRWYTDAKTAIDRTVGVLLAGLGVRLLSR